MSKKSDRDLLETKPIFSLNACNSSPANALFFILFFYLLFGVRNVAETVPLLQELL